MRPTLDGFRPSAGLAAGVILTAVLTAVLVPLHGHVTRTAAGLLFVLPVVLAALLGGRLAGFGVAAFATFAFSLALPPFGSPRVDLSEGLLALIVFSVVAFVVSALVTTRVRNLQHVDEQRRALLRSVSHDLRTPLSAVRAVATDLRAGAGYDQATRDRLLDVLIDEAERLDRLVANLLSMSRIEAGDMRPQRGAVDVNDLAQACASHLRRLFTEWKLIVSIPSRLPLVNADAAQIEQVLNNLLENVARHTPPGTTVRVTASATDRAVEIAVADDGPGWTRGRSGSLIAGPEPKPEDAGLGLAICRAIVELHDGRFHIDEHGPGTRVTFTLPRIG